MNEKVCNSKNEYEYTPLFYPDPMWVKWYNFWSKKYEIGVAYGDKIYSDAGLFRIEQVIKNAEKDDIFWDDAVVEFCLR